MLGAAKNGAKAPALGPARKSGALYSQIANLLMDEIRSGKLAVGEIIPPENELAENFNTSRGTVRQALAMLDSYGVISRRQREGTRVISRYPSRSKIDDGRVLDAWANYGRDYPLTVLSVSHKAPPAYGQNPGKKPWLCTTGIRHPVGSKTPVSYCQSYVHPDYAQIESTLRRTSIPIYAQIEQKYGRVVDSIRLSLRAVAIPDFMAADLKAEAGEPALELTRHYMNKERKIIAVSVNTHPQDRYTHSIEVQRVSSEKIDG